MVSSRVVSLFLLLVLLLGGMGVLVLSATGDGAEDGAAAAPFKFYAAKKDAAGAGLGAEGYDVVAYFSDNAAVPGAAEFAGEFGGVVWRFASAENREAFFADPEKYLPRYGGHCAYGAANGYLVRGDPQAWSIRDGVLYLNYNKSVRRSWLANDAEFIRLADANWPELAAGEEAE